MGDYPETPTDWNAWDTISKGLQNDGNNRVLPLWIWLPIGLITTGILGYWLGQTQYAQPSITQSENIIDTVYISSTNTIRDTVYQEKYVTEWKYKNAIFNDDQIISSVAYQNLLASKTRFENQLSQYQNTLSNHPIAYHPLFATLPGLRELAKQNNPIENLANPNSITDRLHGINIESITPLELALLQSNRRLIAGLNVYKYPIPSLKSKKSILEHIIPDYVNIGASLEGPFSSFTQEGTTGIEFGGGIHTELLFSPKFSVVTGFRSRNNTTSITDETEALKYPQPLELNPGEIFKNLNIKTNFLDIPLHLKYKYSTTGIEKYIIAGILTTKTSSREYAYEYSTANGETYREVNGVNSGWTIGTATLGMGFEYGIGNSFNVFAEPYARFNFKTSTGDRNEFHGIGLRLGLVYEL